MADAIAAIHVLEHFYEFEAFSILTEWKRILKPGGKLILELPCLDKIFSYMLYCVNHKESFQRFMTLDAFYGAPTPDALGMAHKFGWFTDPLKQTLAHVGFRDITVMDARYHFPFRDFRIECIK